MMVVLNSDSMSVSVLEEMEKKLPYLFVDIWRRLRYNSFTIVNELEIEMLQIANAEWEVMRVVWASEEVTSSYIIDILQQNHDWSDSTIKTMITRLSEKGLLSSRREGRRFWYRAVISEEEGQWKRIEETFDKICITKRGKLLAALMTDTPMTEQDIAMFESILQAKKATPVSKIMCQCLPGQCSCHH
ncbi:putative transcriptional regulator [Streptococcus acidominimus]|nr:putative transcriptional regulator [Streptococcus acidominimus]